MIGYILVDILRQFLSWLYEHQWARWEKLTIGIVVLGVLLLIIRRLRKRAVRSVYENQFMESLPVIGMNLGGRKRSRHLKKGRLAAAQKRHPKQQKSTKQTEPSEKLHEQIKQLQYEIIKRKQAESRFEQRVASLAADNEKLRREVAESRQVERQSSQEDDEVPAADEKTQPEVAGKKQAEQEVKEQAAEEPAEKKPVGSGSKYEDFHRVVDGVKQKLCRKCNEWKPESEFYKNASCKDGLAASCKVCKTKVSRQYRERRRTEKNNNQ